MIIVFSFFLEPTVISNTTVITDYQPECENLHFDCTVGCESSLGCAEWS